MRNDKKQMKPKAVKNKQATSDFMVYGISWFEWEKHSTPRHDGYSLFTREAERKAVIDIFYETPLNQHGDSIDKTFEINDEKLFRKIKKNGGRYNTEELA
jgi:hypothetical protein